MTEVLLEGSFYGPRVRNLAAVTEAKKLRSPARRADLFQELILVSMLGACPAVISPVLFSFETMTLESGGVSILVVVLAASSSSLVQITSIVPS